MINQTTDVDQAAAVTREARRRSEEVQAARRESNAFANDVAGRIGACSKAHVRFMQLEQRDAHRRMLAASIHSRLDQRRQRDARIERDMEERRRALAAIRADANRCARHDGIELNRAIVDGRHRPRRTTREALFTNRDRRTKCNDIKYGN